MFNRCVRNQGLGYKVRIPERNRGTVTLSYNSARPEAESFGHHLDGIAFTLPFFCLSLFFQCVLRFFLCSRLLLALFLAHAVLLVKI